MKDNLKNQYKLTEEEKTFLLTHNGFNLGADLLREDDPEGPAHQLFRKYIDLETKGTMDGIITLVENQAKTKRRERRKAILSAIPLIGKFVKRNN
ncbi:MAG TPA: hypothetical protein VF189_00910 [Patescibacteria group bacterium]